MACSLDRRPEANKTTASQATDAINTIAQCCFEANRNSTVGAMPAATP